ncbi:hypothetical protein DENSPDRAFT_886309 [Dentipellis sp. KUC8613]|nr:hypothetical protein DENSPDRAFT_886309 [Dentipellis sp. KUC8613]
MFDPSPALAPSSSLPPTPPLVRASARLHLLVSHPGFALARPPRVLAPLALPRASLTPSHPSRASSRPSRPRLDCFAPSHPRRARASSRRRADLARLARLSRALVAPLHRRAGPAPLHPFRARRALFALSHPSSHAPILVTSSHRRVVAPSRPSGPSRARPRCAFLFAPSSRRRVLFAPSRPPHAVSPSSRRRARARSPSPARLRLLVPPLALRRPRSHLLAPLLAASCLLAPSRRRLVDHIAASHPPGPSHVPARRMPPLLAASCLPAPSPAPARAVCRLLALSRAHVPFLVPAHACACAHVFLPALSDTAYL